MNGVLPHLHARDATMVYVSSAPLEKLRAYKQRRGWGWGSCAGSDFSFDLGFSRTEEQTREAIAPMLAGDTSPIIERAQNAEAARNFMRAASLPKASNEKTPEG